MSSLYCVGNSHMRAIMRAAPALGLPIVAHSLKDPMHEGDERSVGQRIADAVAAVRRDRPERLLCFVGGGAPATLGTLLHPRPFDFRLPWRADLPFDAEAEAIPYDAVRAVVQNFGAESFRLLTRLRSLSGSIAQFESPPPLFDNAVLLDLSRRLQRKLNDRDGTATSHAIAPPWLRYKLWTLHSRLFEEFCAAQGIAFVRNPAGAFDAQGFLAPDCVQDLMHGNERYGELVLRSFLARPQAG
jgi:hypothetical protein